MSLTQKEAKDLFLPRIAIDGSLFEKFQKVWVRPAIVGEKVITITSDGKETENTAKEGDYVIMAKTEAEEQYIISGDKLAKRYKKGTVSLRAGGPKWEEYVPIGTVRAIEFHPSSLGFTVTPDNPLVFIAPWNEETVLKKGDMVCTTDGSEVYRIARKEFEQTYRISAN